MISNNETVVDLPQLRLQQLLSNQLNHDCHKWTTRGKERHQASQLPVTTQRPYYPPETPAAASSSQVFRSARSSSASRVCDYSQSPARGMSGNLCQLKSVALV